MVNCCRNARAWLDRLALMSHSRPEPGPALPAAPPARGNTGWWRLSPQRLAWLCLLPFLAGLIHRLLRPMHQFMDADAMVCAGQQVLAHGTAYDVHVLCPGIWPPMPYVYTPPAAWIMALLQGGEGTSFALGLYGALYFGILVAVFRALLRSDSLTSWRAPFLLGLSGSALPMGNLSVILHGALFFAATALRRRPLLLWPLIVLAGILKPPFGIYAVLPLFCEAPLRRRIVVAVSAALVLAGALLLFRLATPHGFAQWIDILTRANALLSHGHGFQLVAPHLAGHSAAGLILLYGLYAALLLAAAALLLPRLAGAERMALGVLICLLLYPRLMDYDFYTAPFGLAVLASLLAGVPKFRTGLFLACLAAAAVGGLTGGLLFYLLSLVVLFAAALGTYRQVLSWPAKQAT